MPFTQDNIDKINAGITAYIAKKIAEGKIPASQQAVSIAQYQKIAGVDPNVAPSLNNSVPVKSE